MASNDRSVIADRAITRFFETPPPKEMFGVAHSSDPDYKAHALFQEDKRRVLGARIDGGADSIRAVRIIKEMMNEKGPGKYEPTPRSIAFENEIRKEWQVISMFSGENSRPASTYHEDERNEPIADKSAASANLSKIRLNMSRGKEQPPKIAEQPTSRPEERSIPADIAASIQGQSPAPIVGAQTESIQGEDTHQRRKPDNRVVRKMSISDSKKRLDEARLAIYAPPARPMGPGD